MSDDKKPRCFVIMPISDQPGYPEGHFTKVYKQIFYEAIDEAGYEPYRVDEDNICDSIILKISDGIQNCEMALCDLSSRNPNVLYELGLRQAYDKPVVLVQDEKTERIFDVGGINTIPYNSDRLYESVIDARQKITQALKDSKNGKGYSLIKIVKANKASFPEGDLSGNEKTEIMLNTIMDEIIRIKNANKTGISIISREDEIKELEKEIALLELEVLGTLNLDGKVFDNKSINLRKKISYYTDVINQCNLTIKQEEDFEEKLFRINSLLESYVLKKRVN